VVRRSVYAPALVAFLIHDHDVSVRISIGLPGLWWVALSWGEPVLPWWGHHRHRWHPRWDGWGGPRVVNNVVVKQTTIINVGDIHYHNAKLPRAVRTAPADRFGRERTQFAAETRYRHEEFAPLRGEMPVKPSRESLFGGAPKAAQPPREVVTRAVVSTRPPREKTLPWKEDKPRVQPQPAPEFRYVKPPARRDEERALPQRPPFGAEAGPERTPPPQPPRLREVAGQPAPPSATREREAVRRETVTREQSMYRKEAPAVSQPVRPPEMAPAQPSRPAPAPSTAGAGRAPAPKVPAHVETRREERAQPLPGRPANQTYRGQEQKVRSWEDRSR
jgi:hypothetical protein